MKNMQHSSSPTAGESPAASLRAAPSPVLFIRYKTVNPHEGSVMSAGYHVGAYSMTKGGDEKLRHKGLPDKATV